MSCGVDENVFIHDSEWRVSYSGKHRCTACREGIPAGARYWLETYTESGFYQSTVRRCQRCERIHAHLLDRMDDTFEVPAPALDCGDTYEERWGEQPSEEIAALAFALPGESI